MDYPDIALNRMVSQQLIGTRFQTPKELVEWFGAIQGQEYEQTKWGIGLKLLDTCDSDIEKALEEGNILRTHILRPTWHFVSKRDILWMTELTGSRIFQACKTIHRQLGLDAALFHKCNDLITSYLEGENFRTRYEIQNLFKQHRIEASGNRLALIMMQAESKGLICSGKRKGNKATYALLTERAGNPVKLSREEALAELSRRYFQSRGPATDYDFSTWSGLTLTDCRSGIFCLGKELEHFTIDGQNYYHFHGMGNIQGENRIFLLPKFDEMIYGYKNRDANMVYINSINPDYKFRYFNRILHAGQFIGSWDGELNKIRLTLTCNFSGNQMKINKHY